MQFRKRSMAPVMVMAMATAPERFPVESAD
jgi:hypothetical protein